MGVPGAISKFLKSNPLWGPTNEDLVLSGCMAEKSKFLGDPPTTPWDPWVVVG